MGSRNSKTSTELSPTLFSAQIPRPRHHSNPLSQTLINLGEICLGTLEADTFASLNARGLPLTHWNDKQFLMIVHLIDGLKNLQDLSERTAEQLFAMTYMILEGTQGAIIYEQSRIAITTILSIDGNTIIKPFRSSGMLLTEWLKECFNHLNQSRDEIRIYWRGISLIVMAITLYLEQHEPG